MFARYMVIENIKNDVTNASLQQKIRQFQKHVHNYKHTHDYTYSMRHAAYIYEQKLRLAVHHLDWKYAWDRAE